MATVIGTEGLVLGTTLYLLAGFFCLLMAPKWIGTVDLALKGTFKFILDDAIRRAYYIMALTAYWLTGAYLYTASVDLSFGSEHLFMLITTLFSVAIFIMVIYMILKLVADAINMIKIAVAAKEYGRSIQ